MSQGLTGTFGALFAKAKPEKRQRRKPGPEWDEPLFYSRLQLVTAGGTMLTMAHAALSQGNPASAATSLYNGYLLVKGLHNYRITKNSAEQAPLRDLLGTQAPANDNLLTPAQSLSNSCTLLSRTFMANIAGIFGFNGYEAASRAVPPPAALAFWSVAAAGNGFFACLHRREAARHGPTRMPGITGKLAP